MLMPSLGDDVADTARFAIAWVEMLARVDDVLQLYFKKYEFLLAAVHIRKSF